MEDSEDEAGTAQVGFTVRNARPIVGKSLFALADVEMRVAGVIFAILGVQARRLPDGGTTVSLPTFKDADGSWRPAIELPEELRAPLATAVLAFLVEQGLARHKFVPAHS